jgi:hypothetical protein
VIRASALAAVLLLSSGCLVVSLQPAYDDTSIVFDEALVGKWTNVQDRTSAEIERSEWRSYKIIFTDRFTTLTLHGNLTAIGAASFLDVTQARGTDPGPYLVPVHGIYRIAVKNDTLTATALDYGWFTRAMSAHTLGNLTTALDDRRNVAIVSPTDLLRTWLANVSDDAFGAVATYTRASAH